MYRGKSKRTCPRTRDRDKRHAEPFSQQLNAAATQRRIRARLHPVSRDRTRIGPRSTDQTAMPATKAGNAWHPRASHSDRSSLRPSPAAKVEGTPRRVGLDQKEEGKKERPPVTLLTGERIYLLAGAATFPIDPSRSSGS